MMTGTLALLIRSLRTDARLVRSHVFRLVFVGLIYAGLIFALDQSAFIGAPGLRFLRQIAWLNVLLLTVAGATFFSTVITEEKEEGTLGLLRMAGISPLSLLLGKSVPRLLAAVLLLSMQLPFTLLSITLGGVTVHQVFALYAGLAAYLLFISQFGLFASVACRRSRKATWLVFSLLFVFIVAPPYVSMIVSATTTASAVPWWTEWGLAALGWLARLSIYQRTMGIMQTGFADPIASTQVVSNLIAAGVLFALSWATFDLFNRGEALAGPERGLQWWLGQRRGRAPRVWSNPFLWKDFHFMAGGTPMIAAKFLAYSVLIAVLTWSVVELDGRVRGFPRDYLAGCTLGAMLVAAAVELGMYASRVFHEEIQWRTLPVLLTLPRALPIISYSKLAGCLFGLAPAATLFAAGVLVSPKVLGDAIDDAIRDSTWLFLFTQFIVFIHLTAFLSLFLRWGAAPLSFIGVFVLGWFIIVNTFIGPSEAEQTFRVLFFVGLCACAILHLVIGRGLKIAAAR